MAHTITNSNNVIPEPEEPPQKPSLTTTPTTTIDDVVEVEVNGEAGEKNFSISLKDDKGNESEALTFSIEKKSLIIIKFGIFL